jgi:hypothetical protein
MTLDATRSQLSCIKSSTKTFLITLLGFIVSLSSSFAWKVSDVDFAKKLGIPYLENAYLLTAAVLFVGAMSFVIGLKRKTIREIFFIFQKYSLLSFGCLGITELFFHISTYPEAVFLFKVIGYAYSSLVVIVFWLLLNPYSKYAQITAGQYTAYITSTYFGMTVAGLLLRTSISGTHLLGAFVALCSFFCLFLSKAIYKYPEPIIPDNVQSIKPTPLNVVRALYSSQTMLMLVIGSVLLNILISSTEYSVISDFERRFATTAGSNGGNQTLGSFVALTGAGNIAALLSSRLVYHCYLGSGGISLAAIFAAFTLYCGFSDGNSLLISGLALVITESLYPLVVESNLARLLNCFPESQKVSARGLMSAITEPVGLLLSALLLRMSWITICTLGIGTIVVSFLLFLYSCAVEGKWLEFFSKFRQKKYFLATRLSTLMILFSGSFSQNTPGE